MKQIINPFKDATPVIGTEKVDRHTTSLKNELRGAKTEEDVRQGTITFLKNLTKEVGVNVKIQNEMAVLSGGRIDSLFDNIIFEFKKPEYFDTPHGITEAIEGRKDSGGLVDYMISRSCIESTSVEDFKKYLSAKVGIGFDGKSFIFVRYVFNVSNEINLTKYREKFSEYKWFPETIDGYFERNPRADIKSGLRFLFLYLRSISPRAPLTPINVSERFGENSAHFKKHLKVIYSTLKTKLENKDKHTVTLYGEWDRVFGKVYGDINTTTSDIKQAINEKYKQNGFLDEDIDLKHLIFSIHTYYNIILKLLVSNLFSTLLNPFSSQRAILSLGDDKFGKEIINIVDGESFKLLNVENFFESGFFEWWTYDISSDLSEMLREVIILLEDLEVTTSITKPELIGDMVKHTYHELMPQALRHLLGEYFTPDWLAEYAIETSGYTGKLGETILDPACGSGTFLTIAIRKKILNNKIERKTVIRDILQTITGFDLNPISVIASKTNYLLSLGDFTDLEFPIKIPVYQCDSILTPTVHAMQKKESEMFTIDTVCGTFNVPALGTREAIEGLLDVIGTAIKNKYTNAQLLSKLRLDHKGINEEATLELFDKIGKLTEKEEDGLWIPILKNSFAPVYSEGQYEFVIGNPPWVSWKSMSKSYRELTLPIWLSYDIFDKSAYDKITTHDDFAMAFTYVSADHYLKPNGKLCFVISQTFFKSKKGGEGFRKFEITRNKTNVPLKAKKVVDMVAVKPFAPEVSNRTSVVLIEKGIKTIYPAPYFVWTPKSKVREHDTLLEVKRKITESELQAIPIGGTDDEKGLRSPWLTLPAQEMIKAKKAIGASDYRGRKGVEPSGAKGIFLLKQLKLIGKNKIRIVNQLSRGRLKEIEALGEQPGLIDETFVYPLISGRDIVRYGLVSCSYILLPHVSKKGVHNAVSVFCK
jgi:N-6 DNA Methylase